MFWELLGSSHVQTSRGNIAFFSDVLILRINPEQSKPHLINLVSKASCMCQMYPLQTIEKTCVYDNNAQYSLGMCIFPLRDEAFGDVQICE